MELFGTFQIIPNLFLKRYSHHVNMPFGATIKRLREPTGMSVQKLADRIGVDAARMRKWEEKDLTPRHEDQLIIEEFFGISLEEIGRLESIKKFLTVPKKEIPSQVSDKEAAYILERRAKKITPNAKAIADPPPTEILATEGIIPLADGKYLMNTPLIPVKAYAGYITSWGDEEYINDLPVHPIIVDQAHRGEYKSFEVTGDSMDDGSKYSIEDRSIATGRRLDRSHWKNKFHLKKFSRYIIVSLDGILIKEIIDHDTKTGIITCHSLNPDKKQYPDFELSLDRVIQIFNVVQVTKKE